MTPEELQLITQTLNTLNLRFDDIHEQIKGTTSGTRGLIESIRDELKEDIAGIKARQDIANGKVLKHGEELKEIKTTLKSKLLYDLLRKNWGKILAAMVIVFVILHELVTRVSLKEVLDVISKIY